MIPTQAILHEILNYNQETGEFHWRHSGKGRRPDLSAGTVTNHGYLHIMIDGRRYLAHQLAWMYVYGYFPKEMDHIDRDPLNNRFTNLRDITHSNNSVNSKTRWDNSSGQKGVCFDKQKGKWKVQATIAPGKRIAKHFCCFEEAAAFYKEQMNLHRGEYTPV